jgi:hypothetical protein
VKNALQANADYLAGTGCVVHLLEHRDIALLGYCALRHVPAAVQFLENRDIQDGR